MSQIKIKKVLETLSFQLFLFSASLFAWGPDIPIWTEGKVNCFDVDYALDGTIFVAFQPEGTHLMYVYESRDRGYTWDYLWVTDAPSGVGRVRIIADNNKKRIYLFFKERTQPGHYVTPDNRLWMKWVEWEYARASTLPPGPKISVVSDGPIIETSFDVAFDGNMFYVVWLEDYQTNMKKLKIFRGYEWHPDLFNWVESYNQAFDWTEGEGTRATITYGPPTNLYVAYCCHSSSGSGKCFLKSTDRGITWLTPECFHHPTVRYYDPRVAAANVDEPGVWIAYNSDRGGHEIDLYVLYIRSHGLPNDVQISGLGGVDEYIADIKFYKIYSCEYINMVYIHDEEGQYRKAYWMWTSQSDPLNWYDKVQVNDQDITSWPEDVAPRLVYSPGNWASGSGVVFSYFWKHGLYFDAPWNTISGGLLIITANEFTSALQRLVDWKNNTGIPTYMVNWETLPTQGRDKSERIKYTIDFYYRQHGVRYVMLVGDSEKLPVRYVVRAYEKGKAFAANMLNRHWSWDDESGHHEETWSWCSGGQWYRDMAPFVPAFFCSELYYADLYDNSGVFDTWDANRNGYFGEVYRNDFNSEGINLLPDVAVGRVPASNVSEVNNYVTKVINYESHAWNSDWFRRALIFANDEDANWTACGQSVASTMGAAGFDTLYYELKNSLGEVADEHIQRELQKGLGFLLYIGHGPWGMGAYQHWVETGYMLPIVCHTGCHPGDFGPNVLCFSRYRSIDGTIYNRYEDGQHYPCDQFPPPPDPLQPAEIEGSYPEFLLCADSNRGAVAFYGATYATQNPSSDLGKFFFEGYPKGYKLLGDIWIETIKRYYHTHMTSLAPGKESFRGTEIWHWYPSDAYFMIQKFVLFGDPSLRVGGVPSTYTGVADRHTPPLRQFKLVQNYPNPFNSETIIKYELAKETDVSLKIYNILGQLVISLVDKKQIPGTYTVRWDGRDENGRQMPTGIYFVTMRTIDFSKSCKMMLIR